MIKQILGSIISLASVIILYMELAGKKVPLIPGGYRTGFYALFVLGLIACAVGGIGANASNNQVNWTSPFTIFGSIVGVLTVVLFFLVLTNKHFWFIQSDKDALIAIGVVIILKWLSTLIHGFFK